MHVPPVRTAPPARTNRIERPLQYDPATTARKQTLAYKTESLRLGIEDLIETFGSRYPRGQEFLARWQRLSTAVEQRRPDAEKLFTRLRDDALLANPLLDFDRLLVLKRQRGQLGLPTNHQCNTCLKQDKYDNELAILSPVRPTGTLSTLFRPDRGWYVGEMDLHHDADRLLFTMPNGRTWQIHEMSVDGSGLRQVSREIADVDNFDPCYLPDGRIVFASTAAYTGVPCWHGKERACCLYTMHADGTHVRQLCYDQDLDLHPSILDNGQVIFSRWDYTGLLHAYVRPLMVMNPDGTGQRAVYGSNSYYPNCLFFPRGVPGHPNKIAAILSGYHGKNRMGELAILNVGTGWSGEQGIVHRITHRGEPIVPVALDALTEQAQHQFLHPYPLSDKYILAAMQTGQQPWGIYLVDVFDNMVPILTDPRFSFFEPIPVASRPAPPSHSRSCGHHARRRDRRPARHLQGRWPERRAAWDHQATADRRLSLRLSRHGGARQSRSRRTMGGRAYSRHRSGLRRWFGQVSASGKYSGHAASLGCRGEGGATDAQLVHGDAR